MFTFRRQVLVVDVTRASKNKLLSEFLKVGCSLSTEHARRFVRFRLSRRYDWLLVCLPEVG